MYGFELSLNKDVANQITLKIIIESLNIYKIIIILKYFIFTFFQNLYLLFGLILIVANIILKYKFYYINFYLIINIVFIFLVYLFVNDAVQPHEFIVKTGIERIIFNISPIFILLFVELVNSNQKINN